MRSKSNALIKRAVRPLLEGLETRKLFAMTVVVADLDDNGTLDMQIQGDNTSETVTIVDYDKNGSDLSLSDPAATFSIDANNDGDFDDVGDEDGAVLDTSVTPLRIGGGLAGPIETYDIVLEGGEDTLNFTLGEKWNDSEKAIDANLSYSEYSIGGLPGTDNDTFVFDTNGYEIRNKTDLTIDLTTGQDHDVADIDFDKLNRALINLNLDLGDSNSDLPTWEEPLQSAAFDSLDVGTGEGGDETYIDFNGEIGNWSSVSVNVQYGETGYDYVSYAQNLEVLGQSIASLTLVVFHGVVDNSDVELNIQGASSGFDIRQVNNAAVSLDGSAINIAGVLFRSDLKNDTEVFVNYNGGRGSIDLVGVGLDKGFDQRANADLYVNLQGGDGFDVLALATTNILPPVSLASGETNTVEWNTGSKFYYTLNLGDGGFRQDLSEPALAAFIPFPEQAFVMLGYNFFNDGADGPISDGDDDIISDIVTTFLNENDVRVHAGAKHRARVTGGNGDDDLYLGYGITNHSPTSTGNFDITVEGNNGNDYVAYAFDKAGGSPLTAANFAPQGKALLDGGSHSKLPLFAVAPITTGDVLNILVDDGKSRNRNFEVNGSYPNL